MGELRIECDECVRLELGQGDVLGVICVGPPEVVGDLPGDVLKNALSGQSDPQPAHVAEPSPGIFLVISPWCTAWQSSDSICGRRSAGARIWCSSPIATWSRARRMATSGPVTYLVMGDPLLALLNRLS